MTALATVLAAALLAACSGGTARESVKGATTERPATTTSTTSSRTSTIAPSTFPFRPSGGWGRGAARGVQPGETESAVDSGGLTRTFYLRVPPAHDGRRPLPLVVDLHGFGEGAQLHVALSGMADLGTRVGFVTVTPQGSGVNEFWNTFGLPQPDDVAFVRALLDDLDDTLCIDLNRTYASGISNGAFMVSLLACRMADRFAAVAPVAGAQDPQPCTPARPVPVIAFHGTDDTYVRYEGGLGPGVRSLGIDPGLDLPVLRTPVPDVMAAWAARNRCTTGPSVSDAAVDVAVHTWSGCADGADVVFDEVRGGGHTWPGSRVSEAARTLIGPTTMSIDATALIWEFFRLHPLRPAPR